MNPHRLIRLIKSQDTNCNLNDWRFFALNNHNAKKRDIEEIYQKKSQLEHILLRPDTYIGSVEKETK
ncbi:hypothetical protein BLA29_014025, partial [Euroglyphus maynei]